MELTDQQKGTRSKQDIHDLKELKQNVESIVLLLLHKMDQCQKYKFQSSCRFRLSCKKRSDNTDIEEGLKMCAKPPIA